jgi:transposase-like protein
MEHVVRQYSPELKQRIVDELEAGHLSLREAARDTRATVAMVQKWVAEYGRYRPKRDVLEVVMKSEQPPWRRRWRRRICSCRCTTS